MDEDDRVGVVRRLLYNHLESPSLRHIRDPKAVNRLAQEIVTRIDRGNSYWTKWDPQRETLLKSAMGCWVPTEEMHRFLNSLAGPKLTVTDVEQRFRAFEEEEWYRHTREELQSGCLELYEKEKSEGTELPAIIGALRDYIEREEVRLQAEANAQYRQRQELDRLAREQRLMSGADCPWTQLHKSPHWFYRANGRTFRLSPTKDKKWELYRVKEVSEGGSGNFVGKYQGRGEATKVIKQIAYQPEPFW